MGCTKDSQCSGTTPVCGTPWSVCVPCAKKADCVSQPAVGAAHRAGPLPDVPLLRRVAYGFLAREGMRTEEMARLRWRDVDLEHEGVNLERDKTGDPRDWDLRPDVVEALRRWKERPKPHTEPSDYVFAEDGVPLNVEHLAEQIRNDLCRVGVNRPQLFEDSKTRQRFRAHDLRATFVTIALAMGKTETWVSDRTGHDGHSMIERYRRKARTWNLGELGPLHVLIPELAETEPTVRIGPGIPPKFTARVAKLADAADLGSAAARRKGSSPFPCTFGTLREVAVGAGSGLRGNPWAIAEAFEGTRHVATGSLGTPPWGVRAKGASLYFAATAVDATACSMRDETTGHFTGSAPTYSARPIGERKATPVLAATRRAAVRGLARSVGRVVEPVRLRGQARAGRIAPLSRHLDDGPKRAVAAPEPETRALALERRKHVRASAVVNRAPEARAVAIDACHGRAVELRKVNDAAAHVLDTPPPVALVEEAEVLRAPMVLHRDVVERVRPSIERPLEITDGVEGSVTHVPERQPHARFVRKTNDIGAVDPALQRAAALGRQVDHDRALGRQRAIHDLIRAREGLEIDRQRELPVGAEKRSVRRIGVDGGERRRAVDTPLREQPRDDALAHATLLTADEIDLAHAR